MTDQLYSQKSSKINGTQIHTMACTQIYIYTHKEGEGGREEKRKREAAIEN